MMSEAVVKYTARDFKTPYRYSELSGEIFTIGKQAFAVTGTSGGRDSFHYFH